MTGGFSGTNPDTHFNLLLTWLARNAEDSPARRAIIWHLFVYDAIALVATSIIQLSGGLNAFGWGIVAVYLFFTIGFGRFLLPRNVREQ